METSEWREDILGDGYESLGYEQADDYSGRVRTTVVRRVTNNTGRQGVLYVHGFSDYFLQYEMGRRFNEAGIAFYAVDLRKYGRSHIQGQRFFEVRDLREYFADIEVAIAMMKRDGLEDIVLSGHSTGGLTSALYMNCSPEQSIRGLMLNSPFLAWNLPWYKLMMIPLISFIGIFWPGMRVAQPKDTSYAMTLRRGIGGEWDYDVAWKPDQMPDVDAGWVRAVEKAQRHIRKASDIKVPVLVLTSSGSAYRGDPTDVFLHNDGVLDVTKIRRDAEKLGKNVEIRTIDGGLHDLSLSSMKARDVFYDEEIGFCRSIFVKQS